MSRILAYTSPAPGNLFPLVPILDELRGRGHEVALRTSAGQVEGMLARGFEAAAIAPEVEALSVEDWRARTVPGAQARAARTIRARAPHDSRDFLLAIGEERPDAVIVDVLATGAIRAAASSHGTWSCYRPFPLPSFGIGPATLGIARPLAVAPLHIYMSAEPFERPRSRRPDNLLMVGPCPWEPPGELPSVLAEMDVPLILVTSSSEFQNDGRLVEAALAGLADKPVHVVATIPSEELKEAIVPANATVLRFAPHSPVLAHAACAVTHGGMGATQKALSLGVPVCAVPFGRDQPDVARRVVAAGAGTRLPARRLTPRRLWEKVEEAIACRPGAERLAKAFAETGGAPLAADEIERRLL